jgi:DNA modification methylase
MTTTSPPRSSRKKSPPAPLPIIPLTGDGRPELVPVGDLHTYPGNPNVGDIPAIARSLAALGQYRPIVVNRGTLTGRPMEVLAGNHTFLAARDELAWPAIQSWVIDVDQDQAATIVAGDNHLAQLASTNEDDLIALLLGIDPMHRAVAGYSETDMLRMMRGRDAAAGRTHPDDLPDDQGPPVTAAGDTWQLGPHRLVCGSATDRHVLLELLAGERADVLWTDPPYGVEVVGGTRRKLRIANDTLGAALETFSAAVDAVAGGAILHPAAPAYICHADTQRAPFERILKEAGFVLRQNLIWVKSSLVLSRADYHYQHEPVLLASAADLAGATEVAPEPVQHQPVLYGFAPKGKATKLGRLGRGGPRWFGDNTQTTVFCHDKPARSEEHPTMKPVALVRDMLSNSMPDDGVVLDPFGGSGTTLIAAHQLGGRARLVELDPRYVDVAAHRFQEFTGIVPIRDGEPFDFCGTAHG